MKVKYSLNLVFGILTVLFVLPAHAAWYQVEVIVFENISPSSDGELWDENPGLPDRSDSIELITELADNDEDTADVQIAANENQQQLRIKAELIPFLQSTEDKLRLDGVRRVLQLSREYHPLLHVAWQQQGLPLNNARAVHLQKFVETENSVVDEAEDLEALRYESILPDAMVQVPDLVFDGTIRLRSSTFLHVDVDIAYFPEFLSKERASDSKNDSPLIQQQADYVRLQESRKIRLNEINYFDHPAFGVILRVSRLNIN